MKKTYEAPEIEISEFSLKGDILSVSGPEGPLPEFGSNGEGFQW